MHSFIGCGARRLAIVIAALVSGCSRDPAPADGDTTTTSSSGGASSSSSANEVSTGAAESTGTPGDGLLECIETCEVPSECCLPGSACPGAYPFNVDCRDGMCVRPHCEDDDACAAITAGMVCRGVRGVASCVLPCTDDGTCTSLGPYYVCRGTTDEGEAHCFEHCDQPGVFCGNETCDVTSGLCTCTSDGQCQSDWRCVD